MENGRNMVRSEEEALNFDQYSIEELKQLLGIERLMYEVFAASVVIADQRKQRGNEVNCFNTRSLCERKIEKICESAEELGIPLFDTLFSEQVVVELLERVSEENALFEANQRKSEITKFTMGSFLEQFPDVKVGPLLGFGVMNCASKVMLLSHCGESCEGLEDALREVPTDKFFGEEAMKKIVSNPFLSPESQALFLVYVMGHYKGGCTTGKQQPLRSAAQYLYFQDSKYMDAIQERDLCTFAKSDLDVILENDLLIPPSEEKLSYLRLLFASDPCTPMTAHSSSSKASVTEQESPKIYGKFTIQK